MELADILTRVRELVVSGISELEAENLDSVEKRNASDRERDARTLRSLIKAVEEVSALEQRLQQLCADETQTNAEFDAEKRDEIARRIEALRSRHRRNSKSHRNGKP